MLERLEAAVTTVGAAPASKQVNPLAKTSAVRLGNAKADERGIVRSTAKSCLDIRVARGSVDRALRLMDELATLMEASGCELVIIDEGAVARVLGLEVPFYLEERLDRTQRELTPAQRRELERHPWTRGSRRSTTIRRQGSWAST